MMRKGLMISMVCAGCAFGQTTAPPKQLTIHMADAAEFGAVGITTALAFPIGAVTGAPYSAQVTTDRVQTLADGNRIQQSTSGSVARDSQGRVRRDEGLPGLAGANGEAPHIVMIDDPVAQVHWTLDAQMKIAVKMPMPPIKNGQAPVGPPGAIGAAATGKTFFYSSAGPPPLAAGNIQIFANTSGGPMNDANVSETDLGTQNIEGVAAQGKRTTRTIPAGQVGNEQPIVITSESWYSPDLKVLVMSKSSDPRMGETTYKLTNIQRAEPAASLFQVPDDYTVKDKPGGDFVYQKLKSQ